MVTNEVETKENVEEVREENPRPHFFVHIRYAEFDVFSYSYVVLESEKFSIEFQNRTRDFISDFSRAIEHLKLVDATYSFSSSVDNFIADLTKHSAISSEAVKKMEELRSYTINVSKIKELRGN